MWKFWMCKVHCCKLNSQCDRVQRWGPGGGDCSMRARLSGMGLDIAGVGYPKNTFTVSES